MGSILLVSFALLSQALAVLRPLFPLKPAPPFSGEPIMIGEDFGPIFWQIVRNGKARPPGASIAS
jgi:hypothetical protein